MTSFEAKSAEPVAPWKTGAVTLLGDALHNMTPFRGMGANTALRDALPARRASLYRRRPPGANCGLAAYEREMIEQGFAAVNGSLAETRRLTRVRWQAGVCRNSYTAPSTS